MLRSGFLQEFSWSSILFPVVALPASARWFSWRSNFLVGFLFIGAVISFSLDVYAKKKEASPNTESRSPWGPWGEADAPFFSFVLDARKAGPMSPSSNLTPRGLILKLGQGDWGCFDTDLSDPRSPAPTPTELGRGPLRPESGRFEAVRMTHGGLVLEYSVEGTQVREQMRAGKSASVVERRFLMAPSEHSLILVFGQKTKLGARTPKVAVSLGGRAGASVALLDDEKTWSVRVAPHAVPLEFVVTLSTGEPAASAPQDVPGFASTDAPVPPRWFQTIQTRVKPSSLHDAYVLDDVPLPLENPWKRNVCLADIGFLKDGKAVGVTFDGDVWVIRGLSDSTGEIQRERFASGLHEPMSVLIREDEIFVFDWNGIWRLRDTNGDVEAGVHELFANCFAQTAETREFPSSMKLAPDGSFVISKGGQQGTSLGKGNGMVLRISRDGRERTVLGWGFRGPF